MLYSDGPERNTFTMIKRANDEKRLGEFESFEVVPQY